MEYLQFFAVMSGGFIAIVWGLMCLLTNNPMKATSCGLVCIFGAFIFALGMI